MKLSVVVVSWNSGAALERCLESLMPALALVEGGAELIRVDNGSTDGSDALPAEGAEAMVRLERNYGVAYARNRGIERARGEYIMLLDDDTVITNPSTLAQMVAWMDSHPDAALCAPALYDADGLLQQSFKPYPGLGIKIAHLAGFGGAVASLPEAGADGAAKVDPCYVIGACQLIRAKALKEAGPLDEKIFYGPEDADLCLRLRAAGHRVAFLPGLSITHACRRITRRNPFSRISRLHIKALVHFYIKHRRLF